MMMMMMMMPESHENGTPGRELTGTA